VLHAIKTNQKLGLYCDHRLRPAQDKQFKMCAPEQ